MVSTLNHSGAGWLRSEGSFFFSFSYNCLGPKCIQLFKIGVGRCMYIPNEYDMGYSYDEPPCCRCRHVHANGAACTSQIRVQGASTSPSDGWINCGCTNNPCGG